MDSAFVWIVTVQGDIWAVGKSEPAGRALVNEAIAEGGGDPTRAVWTRLDDGATYRIKANGIVLHLRRWPVLTAAQARNL